MKAKQVNHLASVRVPNASLRWWLGVFAAGAVASIVASSQTLAQGPYYPVNPAGQPYGTTYTGISISSSADLTYLQQQLQALYGSTVTLEVPVPTGDTAPTAGQYDAAVTACIEGILNGSAPVGVTLTTLSNASIAWNISGRTTTASAIAMGIIQVDLTTNNNPTQTIADLKTVTNGLALAQPTQIDTIVPSLLAQIQTKASVAVGIPGVVATAITDIPTDLTRIASIVNSGLTSIANSALTAAQKNALFVEPNANGFIDQVINTTAANNNPAVIQAVTKAFTFSSYLTMATIQQVLASEVLKLPTTNNLTIAAVTAGALASAGSSSAAIQTQMQSSAPSYSTYIGDVVGGYTNGGSTSALDAYLTANHGYADAIVVGAVVKGTLTGAVALQNALQFGVTGAAGDPNPSNVVEEAILANVSLATSTILGAINTSTFTPYGTGVTFGQVALGAAEATPVGSTGDVVTVILLHSASSTSALSSTIVNSVVTNAIDGAHSVNNAGSYADVVYKAEQVARNTTGASGPMVTAAINEINADGGLPYIAAVAAAAGDSAGTNRAAIQSAAITALTAISSTYATAGTDGMNLVQALQTGAGKTFVTMIGAFNTAAAASPDAVIADVYGAVMQDSTEADAVLASAIKQSTVSSATLTTAAENAIVGINASVNPNLQLVDTVATYLKTEGVNGSIQDVFGYVGQAVIQNPTLVKDIAIAAAVVDPDQSNYIIHSVAFNSPTTAYTTVASVFSYAQITNPNPVGMPIVGFPVNFVASWGPKTFPGTYGTIIDQPAAAAAITAGLTTGILEAGLSQSATQTALQNAVAAAVAASITQNGTLLQGPTNPFNAPGDTGKQFQQSDGASTTTFTNQNTVGAAGAITGYIAEVTHSGDSTISAVTEAVLTAATGGAARTYALQMAQAAAQAFAWVAQYHGAAVVNNTVGNPVYDIAEAIAPSVTGFATLTQLENAVAFGITQAEAGVIGAGALGLNATNLSLMNGLLQVKASGNANSDFYLNRSASGDPITDIFSL